MQELSCLKGGLQEQNWTVPLEAAERLLQGVASYTFCKSLFTSSRSESSFGWKKKVQIRLL